MTKNTMNKNKATMVLEYSPGAIRITSAQALQLFTQSDIDKGQVQGKLRTVGPWQLPVSYTALCTSCTFNREVYPVEHGPLHIFGYRTMNNVRESGYQLEGRVSIGGKKFRAFTSSQLFELPNGKLISCAIIHASGAAD